VREDKQGEKEREKEEKKKRERRNGVYQLLVFSRSITDRFLLSGTTILAIPSGH
jgi:hypothetical protein